MEKSPTNVNQKIRVTGFLNKLYNLVDDTSSNNYIRWTESGESFLVYKHEDFAKEILPKFFKHNNFSSFVRQLNMYGFHKVPHLQQGVMASDNSSQESWEFSNPHFQQNQPDLLHFVIRNCRSKSARDDYAPSGVKLIENSKASIDTRTTILDSEINQKFENLARELEKTKDHQITLSTEIKRLKRENSMLWQEASATSHRFVRQQEGVEKIMKFLASVFSHDKYKPEFTNKNQLLLSNIPNSMSKNGVRNTDSSPIVDSDQSLDNSKTLMISDINKNSKNFSSLSNISNNVPSANKNILVNSPSKIWSPSSTNSPFSRDLPTFNLKNLSGNTNNVNNILAYNNFDLNHIKDLESYHKNSNMDSFIGSFDNSSEQQMNDIVIPSSSIVQLNNSPIEDTGNLQPNQIETPESNSTELLKSNNNTFDPDLDKSIETILADIIKNPSKFNDNDLYHKNQLSGNESKQQTENTSSNNMLLKNNLHVNSETIAKLINSQQNSSKAESQLIESSQRAPNQLQHWNNSPHSLGSQNNQKLSQKSLNNTQILPIGTESPVRLMIIAMSTCNSQQFEIFMRLFTLFDAKNNYLPCLLHQLDYNSKSGLGYSLSQIHNDPEFARKAAVLNERRLTNPGLYNILHLAAHGKLTWKSEMEIPNNLGPRWFEGLSFSPKDSNVLDDNTNLLTTLSEKIIGSNATSNLGKNNSISSKKNDKQNKNDNINSQINQNQNTLMNQNTQINQMNQNTQMNQNQNTQMNQNQNQNTEMNQTYMSDIFSDYLKPTSNNANNNSTNINNLSNLYKQLELINSDSAHIDTSNQAKNSNFFDYLDLQNLSNISQPNDSLYSTKMDYSLEDLDKLLLDDQSQHLFSQLKNSDELINAESQYPLDLSNLESNIAENYKFNDELGLNNASSSGGISKTQDIDLFAPLQDHMGINDDSFDHKKDLDDFFLSNLSLLPQFNLTQIKSADGDKETKSLNLGVNDMLPNNNSDKIITNLVPQGTAASTLPLAIQKNQNENSAYLVQQCYENGFKLSRVEFVGDEEQDIAETIQRLSSTHDMVVTTGGLGPTHDDITFEAIASAFNVNLVCDNDILNSQLTHIERLKSQEASVQNFKKNTALEKTSLQDSKIKGLISSNELLSLKKNATIPISSKKYYVGKEFWSPVVITNNVFTFPGVPTLFRSMLKVLFQDYKKNKLEPLGFVFRNLQNSTIFYSKALSTDLCESDIALELEKIQTKYNGIVKIGSYPIIDPNKSYKVKLTVDGTDEDSVNKCYNEIYALINEG
ncbi:hypothetical protein BB561_000302 [Smittium simulii]|uniref:HSF-type DNA-binding domain-containing protein n=1 Tax=Smittium simulii TaxID=133385 RepID=A0A2T9YZR5_9FUNG|nr:hypothetical protein BB561_000302 [Smittium simulii]